MMSNGDARKAHVKRVYQTNPDGSINSDIWIDVLRIDDLTVSRRGLDDGTTRFTRHAINWMDDGTAGGDSQGENANPARKTSQTAITASDGTQIVNLRTIDQMTVSNRGQDDGQTYLGETFNFNNAPSDGSSGNPANRDTTIIQVVNNDLAGLDMSAGPVDWEIYQQALQAGNKDTSQSLNSEVTNAFTINRRGYQSGATGQDIKFKLQNEDLLNLFSPAIITSRTRDTSVPARLDPLQNIVNVGLVPPSGYWQLALSLSTQGYYSGVLAPIGSTELLGSLVVSSPMLPSIPLLVSTVSNPSLSSRDFADYPASHESMLVECDLSMDGVALTNISFKGGVSYVSFRAGSPWLPFLNNNSVAFTAALMVAPPNNSVAPTIPGTFTAGLAKDRGGTLIKSKAFSFEPPETITVTVNATLEPPSLVLS